MSYFDDLRKIDVSEHIEKKGQFSYLSWAWAVDELKKKHHDATWSVVKYDGLPFCKTECGTFVEVEVTVKGISHSQIHPVLNYNNKPVQTPNAFEINTSIQRALVKAIALHGLGLYIYAGEDLPPDSVDGQVDTKPVEMNKVRDAIKFFKDQIEANVEWELCPLMQAAWAKLTNDERSEVQKGLEDKCPGTNKMYKSLLKEYLAHKDAA